MPTELSRTTARKRITLGASFVDVPVITKISFVDPNDRYQETQYSIDNSSGAARRVHTDVIGTPSLPVERIDRWSMLDPNDRGQETQITMDNVTGHDEVPPHFSAHIKTHVVRYKNPDDPNTWIESELIDSFAVLDPNDRGQESVFVLNNPETSDEAQADPNDPNIADFGEIDPPWRTDPFQNLIKVHSEGEPIRQIFVFRRWGESCGGANSAVEQASGDEATGGDWYPVDEDWWISREQAGETNPAAFSPINTTGNIGSSIDRMRSVATRTLLSDLITACISLSHQAYQLPSNQDGREGHNPWTEWLNFTGLGFLDCALLNGPTTGQPDAGNAPGFIYTGVVGYASIDDIGTGSPTIPPGRPPWIPPTP